MACYCPVEDILVANGEVLGSVLHSHVLECLQAEEGHVGPPIREHPCPVQIVWSRDAVEAGVAIIFSIFAVVIQSGLVWGATHGYEGPWTQGAVSRLYHPHRVV